MFQILTSYLVIEMKPCSMLIFGHNVIIANGGEYFLPLFCNRKPFIPQTMQLKK